MYCEVRNTHLQVIYAMMHEAEADRDDELSKSVVAGISTSSTEAEVAIERVKKASISECCLRKVVDARGR